MCRVVADPKLLECNMGNPITGPNIRWIASCHRATDQNLFLLSFLFTGHSRLRNMLWYRVEYSEATINRSFLPFADRDSAHAEIICHIGTRSPARIRRTVSLRRFSNSIALPIGRMISSPVE